MVSVTGKKCEVCDSTRASYGLPGGPPTHCKGCAEKQRLQVVRLKQACVVCKERSPSYGLQGTKTATHCAECAKAVNQQTGAGQPQLKCLTQKCVQCHETTANHSAAANRRPTHCSACAKGKPGMKRVIAACQVEGCEKRACHGQPGSSRRTHCATHGSDLGLVSITAQQRAAKEAELAAATAAAAAKAEEGQQEGKPWVPARGFCQVEGCELHATYGQPGSSNCTHCAADGGDLSLVSIAAQQRAARKARSAATAAAAAAEEGLPQAAADSRMSKQQDQQQEGKPWTRAKAFCQVAGCVSRATYGKPGSSNRTHCATHGGALHLVSPNAQRHAAKKARHAAAAGAAAATEEGPVVAASSRVRKQQAQQQEGKSGMSRVRRRHRREFCRVEGCGKRASYGEPGDSSTHCATHGSALHLVSVQALQRAAKKAELAAAVAAAGTEEGPVVAAGSGMSKQHEQQQEGKPGMKHTSLAGFCQVEGCELRATYGKPGGRRTHCATHGSALHLICIQQQQRAARKARSAAAAAEEGLPQAAADSRMSKQQDQQQEGKPWTCAKAFCQVAGCVSRATYGKPGSSNRTHCATHGGALHLVSLNAQQHAAKKARHAAAAAAAATEEGQPEAAAGSSRKEQHLEGKADSGIGYKRRQPEEQQAQRQQQKSEDALQQHVTGTTNRQCY
jgi:hypothetical protein